METIDHPRLPRAPLLEVHFQGFWFRWVWGSLTSPGARWVSTDWFMRARGANFSQVWLGPVCVGWRSPWLAGPARQLHPELFREPSDLQVVNAAFAHATAKFNLALEEYRVGRIKLDCRIADREQLERIRDCRDTKHL